MSEMYEAAKTLGKYIEAGLDTLAAAVFFGLVFAGCMAGR